MDLDNSLVLMFPRPSLSPQAGIRGTPVEMVVVFCKVEVEVDENVSNIGLTKSRQRDEAILSSKIITYQLSSSLK